MENSSYVEQGTYKIRHKSLGPLITGGLATCSAISFTINDNDIFMTHIDANTDVIKIAKDIQKLYPSKLQISNVKIWYGTGFGQHGSEITQKLILLLTQHLGINTFTIKEDRRHIIEHPDKNIIQCTICHSKSGSLHIIPHSYNCVYNNPVQINYAGFMDYVSSF